MKLTSFILLWLLLLTVRYAAVGQEPKEPNAPSNHQAAKAPPDLQSLSKALSWEVVAAGEVRAQPRGAKRIRR